MKRQTGLIDDEFEAKPNELYIKGIDNKKKATDRSLASRRSLSAAAISNVRTLLTAEQMKDCAEAYANNGIVRTVIDLTVWFILGEHIKFVIEPNEELIEGLDNEQIRKVQDRIAKSSSYKELRRKIIRCNKRVKLHDRLTKFLTHAFIFGRAFLEIKRFPIEEGWSLYGEPQALKQLTPLRVVDTLVNQDTYEFEGIVYNFGKQGQEKKRVDSIDLIAGWHDDNNVLDNTYFSGSSAVWPILSAAQTIEVLCDENIPEFVKAVAEGFGFIYTGTNKKSVTTQIKQELAKSTYLIHNYKDLDIKQIDLARDPSELSNLVQELAKYIFQSMNAPLFLLREDTANFATANQVMQTYKVSKLNRFRQWLADILEAWCDPILADHLGIPVEDIISAEVKIKPIFQDINFETRSEIITGDAQLVNIGVYTPLDVAKDIEDDEVINRLELEEQAVTADEQDSIREQAQEKQQPQQQKDKQEDDIEEE